MDEGQVKTTYTACTTGYINTWEASEVESGKSRSDGRKGKGGESSDGSKGAHCKMNVRGRVRRWGVMQKLRKLKNSVKIRWSQQVEARQFLYISREPILKRLLIVLGPRRSEHAIEKIFHDFKGVRNEFGSSA